MELKVKKIVKVSVDEEDLEGIARFATTLEGSGIVVVAKEKEECSFTPGDTWELNRTENQTTLEKVPVKDE